MVCADSDAEADRLASSIDLNFARRRQGQLPADPEPRGGRGAHRIRRPTARWIAQNRARLVVGSKDKVLAHLEPLIKATQADEVMITSMIYDHEARKHCYALLAEAFGLEPA